MAELRTSHMPEQSRRDNGKKCEGLHLDRLFTHEDSDILPLLVVDVDAPGTPGTDIKRHEMAVATSHIARGHIHTHTHAVYIFCHLPFLNRLTKKTVKFMVRSLLRRRTAKCLSSVPRNDAEGGDDDDTQKRRNNINSVFEQRNQDE